MSIFQSILAKLGFGKGKEKSPAAPARPSPLPAQPPTAAAAGPARSVKAAPAPKPAPKPAAAGQPTSQKATAAAVRATPAISPEEDDPSVVNPQQAQRTAPASARPAPIEAVDVVGQLENLAAKNPEKLNWKVSIVDLLKLLGLDSSRQARNELAIELGCPKELMADSAKMNTWLHKAVLSKIAENGGNIPPEMLN